MDAVLPVVRLGELAVGTGAGWLRPDGRGFALRHVSLARVCAGVKIWVPHHAHQKIRDFPKKLI